VTKDEFAEKLAAKCELSKSKAMEVIDAIFSTRPREGIIATELDAGREFALTGFGSFRTRRSKERKGRDPRTGNEILIKARTVVAFRPGQGLKDRVAE
jgi:integration host factor subunit alpha